MGQENVRADTWEGHRATVSDVFVRVGRRDGAARCGPGRSGGGAVGCGGLDRAVVGAKHRASGRGSALVVGPLSGGRRSFARCDSFFAGNDFPASCFDAVGRRFGFVGEDLRQSLFLCKARV